MNFEIPSTHETGLRDLEIDKALFDLKKEVGGEKKETDHDVEFYKELAKKLREYGISKIKADIEKSSLITKPRGKLESGIFSTRDVIYSSLSIEINGINYKFNFVNDDDLSRMTDIAWYNELSNENFINISFCEKEMEEEKNLAKQFGRNSELDIYDFMSGFLAHEMYHQEREKLESNNDPYEEANADLSALEIIGIPYLLMRLEISFDEIINEDIDTWLNEPHNFGDYKEDTELYKRYTQALKNVIKNNGKELEFESAKKIIFDRWKTSRIEINGKNQKKIIEKDGKQIRQGYYRDENGEYKMQEYLEDRNKAFAPVLTPDILKQIIAEYIRLSEVK